MADTDTKERDGLIEAAYLQAPPHIQEFLSSGKFEAFLNDIRSNENIRIDSMARVSDELLMMLLGMSEPLELAENLKAHANLTDEHIGTLITLANERIFTPLREEMQNKTEGSEIQNTATPIAPLVPLPTIGSVLTAPVSTPGYPPDPTRPTPSPYTPPGYSAPAPPVPSYAPPTLPSPVSNTPQIKNPFAPSAYSAPPAPQFPTPPPSTPIPPPTPVPIPELPTPTMRTMVHDVEAMKEGHTPAPVPYTMLSSTPVPMPQQPITVASAPIPPLVPAVAPLPRPAISSAPLPQSVNPPATRITSALSAKEIQATLKQYGIDPYRELL
ncbi:MAG: hypothetical protein WBK28_01355 [Minisyncoccia bacterium]